MQLEMSMYIYMCVCVCACACVYILFISTYTFIYVYIYLHIFTYIYIYIIYLFIELFLMCPLYYTWPAQGIGNYDSRNSLQDQGVIETSIRAGNTKEMCSLKGPSAITL